MRIPHRGLCAGVATLIVLAGALAPAAGALPLGGNTYWSCSYGDLHSRSVEAGPVAAETHRMGEMPYWDCKADHLSIASWFVDDEFYFVTDYLPRLASGLSEDLAEEVTSGNLHSRLNVTLEVATDCAVHVTYEAQTHHTTYDHEFRNEKGANFHPIKRFSFHPWGVGNQTRSPPLCAGASAGIDPTALLHEALAFDDEESADAEDPAQTDLITLLKTHAQRTLESRAQDSAHDPAPHEGSNAQSEWIVRLQLHFEYGPSHDGASWIRACVASLACETRDVSPTGALATMAARSATDAGAATLATRILTSWAAPPLGPLALATPPTPAAPEATPPRATAPATPAASPNPPDAPEAQTPQPAGAGSANPARANPTQGGALDMDLAGAARAPEAPTLPDQGSPNPAPAKQAPPVSGRARVDASRELGDAHADVDTQPDHADSSSSHTAPGPKAPAVPPAHPPRPVPASVLARGAPAAVDSLQPLADSDAPIEPSAHARSPHTGPAATQAATQTPSSSISNGLLITLSALAAAGTLALAGAAVALYSRLSRREVTAQAARARILDQVRRQPGATPQDVARALGVHHTTARYHLRLLEREGFIIARPAGGQILHFMPGAPESGDVRGAAATRAVVAKRLLDEVARSPGLTVSAATAALGVDRTTVHYHAKNLQAAGLLRVEREGRVAHLFSASLRSDSST